MTQGLLFGPGWLASRLQELPVYPLATELESQVLIAVPQFVTWVLEMKLVFTVVL